jgi:hypothetical protein
MNRDGTGREELIEDLKTMIKDNKKLKDLNDAGFKCILKYLDDGNNFTKRLQEYLVRKCKMAKQKETVTIKGLNAIAIILITKIAVQGKVDEMIEIRSEKDEQFASGEGAQHSHYKKKIGRGHPVGQEYRTNGEGRYAFQYQVGSQSGCCIRFDF